VGIELLPDNIRNESEIYERHHACAILHTDFPSEWEDVLALLHTFNLCKSWIEVGGGRKSKVAETIDRFLYSRGWIEKAFATAIQVDETVRDTPTHQIDCYKNRIALEIEWNNKDPFFDRDLNNFRLLFNLGAISAGIIITRCDELQSIFDSLGRGSSYGSSTTHMSKLLPRIDSGSSGGCPLLIIGISRMRYVETC
jgi:hypothetical protein